MSISTHIKKGRSAGQTTLNQGMGHPGMVKLPRILNYEYHETKTGKRKGGNLLLFILNLRI